MASNRTISTTSIYLLPGMTMKITAIGHYVEKKEIVHAKADGTTIRTTPINGFVLDNTDVGKIEEVAGEPAIMYTHNKFATNYITFYALTGETGRIFVNAVPIHDHSSIVTGGPAYGTYFADDENTETT